MSEREWLDRVVPSGALEQAAELFEQVDVRTDFHGKGKLPPVQKEAPPRPSPSDVAFGSGLGDLTDPYSDRRMITQEDRDTLKTNAQLAHANIDVDKMSDEDVRKYLMGKQGFAGTRINAHYGGGNVPQLNAEEQKQAVDLSTPEARAHELSQLRQNGMGFDASANFQCGATAIVGGAMYGGGYPGLKMLLDNIVADRAKKHLVNDKSGQPWADGTLQALVAGINQGSLTRLQLADLLRKVYDHFNQDQFGNRPATEGLDGHKLNDFIASHKDLQKMFKDNDMGLDSIDLDGDGKGQHLVLGIGHNTRKGGRSMVFDPQARQNKRNSGQFMDSATRDQIAREERDKMKGEFEKRLEGKEGKAWEAEYDKLKEELALKIGLRVNAYKHDSQLVTDANELEDYRRATDYQANGDAKVNELDAQTVAEV